jgi:hypothetical protein
MAISVYDMIEGKWFIELTDGEVIPCEGEAQARELENASAEELARYREQHMREVLTPRLQTVYTTQD